MKCFFISVIFRADCNEIESNIVKLKNVSHLQKSKRKKEIIRTQSEKIVETYGFMVLTYEKIFIRVRMRQ